MIQSEFDQLGAVMEQTLAACGDSPVSLHRYGGEDPTSPISAFRAEVPMEGWTAGFFLWRKPLKGVSIRNVLEVRLQFPSVTEMVFPLICVINHLTGDSNPVCSFVEIDSQEELQGNLKTLWSLLQTHEKAINQLANAPQELAQMQRQQIRQFCGTDIFSLPDKAKQRAMLREWYFSCVLPAAPMSQPERPVPPAPQRPRQSGAAPSAASVPPAAARQRTDSSFWDMLIGALVLMPFWCVFYLLLYTINSDFSSRGMELVIGTDWLEVLFCGWITAFACTFVIPRNIICFRYKRSPHVKEKLQAVARYTTKKARRLFTTLLVLIVTGCTIHLFLYGYSGLAFCSKGFYDRTATFPVGGVYHPYSQVSRCVPREGTMGFLGQKITYQDYVLILKDGTTYHLSSQFGATERQVEEIILPLLEDATSDNEQ